MSIGNIVAKGRTQHSTWTIPLTLPFSFSRLMLYCNAFLPVHTSVSFLLLIVVLFRYAVKESGCFFCGCKHFRQTVQKSRCWFLLAWCPVSQQSHPPGDPARWRRSSTPALAQLMVSSVSASSVLILLWNVLWGIPCVFIFFDRNLDLTNEAWRGVTTPSVYSYQILTNIRVKSLGNDGRRHLSSGEARNGGKARCWQ